MLTGRRCAVLGHPVGHSLSPALHRAAYTALDLDWTFDAVDMTSDRLADFVRTAAAPPWRGLALTMPLKRAVLPLLDTVDDRVRVLGAANTLLWEPDGSRAGANTDVPGLVAALGEAMAAVVDAPLQRTPGRAGEPVLAGARATVVGGGATAAAAVAALHELGVATTTLLARDRSRVGETRRAAKRLNTDLRVSRLDAAGDLPDVLVSTIPSDVAVHALGAEGWHAGWRPDLVADVIYDPWPSPLLGCAASAGAATVTGVDLLAHQAVEQLRLMTGRSVPVDLLRSAAAAALRDRRGTHRG